ncbi:MAG: trigger factor [Planctomycetes bacterium]|nr:trigger factor [Planctomycetota bacterium]
MPSTIKDLGPCEKEIAVTVPDEDIQSALNKSFGELRKQMVLPGFRPGKVPRGILEKRFGDQVRHEVYHDIVKDAVTDAIKEHELDPVSEPHIGDEDDHDAHELPESGGLDFSFTVEIKPEFDLPKYRNLEVTRKQQPVTDDQVEDVLGRIAEGHASWEPVDDGVEYEKGDLVQATATLAAGDHEIADDKAVSFLPEQEMLEGLPFPDAEEVASENAIDATVEVSLTIPDDYSDEDLRGATAEGKLTIEGYKRRIVPPIDDDLATTLGHEDLASFRADVLKDLQSEHDKLADRDVVQKILDILIEKADIPLAEGPTDRMLERQIGQQAMQLQMREGLSAEDAKAKAEEDRDEMRTSIQRDTRAWLLVERIAAKEKIFCLEDDVDESLEKIARQHDAPPSRVREYYEQNGMLPQLRTEVVERKVCEFLRDSARISDEEAGDDAAAETSDSGEG